MRHKQGITLIALVITIIVLLILAGVVIATLFGDNGIITKAIDATSKTEEAQNEEMVNLGYLEDQLNADVIKSLFSWNIDSINFAKLETQVNKLGINTIYAQIPSDLETSIQMQKLIDFCNLKGIELYALDGHTDWYMEEKRHDVLEIMDRINEYNQNTGNNIKGIKLDIEFYLSDKYKALQTTEEKNSEFQTFFEANKEFSEYAKKKGLKYSIDLPVWLDRQLDNSTLEEIIKLDYDHIAYMNYWKEDSVENLSKEIELAKKYNKKIVTIAELQSPEEHDGLEEGDTFYYDGLTACNERFEQIIEEYNYDKLGTSYHEYKSLVDLIERENPEEENKYELELYPYFDEESIEIKSAVLTDEQGNQFQCMTNQYDSSKEYIITFWGLEFGKMYTLTINEGQYMYKGNVLYQNNGDYIIYDSIDLQDKPTYTIELYGYNENYESAVSLNSGKLVNGNTEITGEVTTLGSGINILVFSGLEYDVEYQLQLDDSNYEIVDGGTVIQTDTSNFYYGADVTVREK